MNKKRFWLLFLLISALAIFLRFYQLAELPPSPYWEEAALGYDAFSILKTGKDHHGHSWPLVAFESFGDWKPSLYFYAAVPFVALFELSVLAVRLPAALSGLAIVLGVGWLARLVSSKKPSANQLVAMFLTAISPWAIQFSRAGWEVNLATALILWGVGLFISSWQEKNVLGWRKPLSAILLVLAMYAYHAARLIAPLLGLGLAVMWLAEKKSWRALLLPGLTALVISIPLLGSLNSSVATQRFAETSIFTQREVFARSNELKAQADHSLLSRIFYHRYLLFGQEIAQNFFDHFDPTFLFVSGDVNPRHSSQFVGHFYYFDIILLILGSVYLFQSRSKFRWFLAWWLVVGILPAAVTKTTPHALRILPTLPVWLLVATLGWRYLLELIPKKQIKLGWLSLIVIYLSQLFYFGYHYVKIYPIQQAHEWQYGYQQLVEAVEMWRQENPEKQIYITRELGRPAMYYWFFTQADPTQVQAANDVVEKDQGEFLQYQQINFVDSPAELEDKSGLLVHFQGEVEGEKIKTINGLSDQEIWHLVYRE